MGKGGAVAAVGAQIIAASCRRVKQKQCNKTNAVTWRDQGDQKLGGPKVPSLVLMQEARKAKTRAKGRAKGGVAKSFEPLICIILHRFEDVGC